MLSSSTATDHPVYDSSKRPHPFIEEAIELFRYRDLLFQWVGRNIKLRYKRSALGVLWTLLEPLMLMSILTIVFSTAFRFPLVHFPIYLLSGLILFDFFSRSTNQMVEEIIASDSLAKRIHVPRSTFAVAAILTYLVNWLIALAPLFAIVLFLRHPITPALITLPVGILLTALFALGVGLLVATIGAFFHDVKLVYGVLLTAWLYATPIIYPIEIIPERMRGFFQLNPLYHLCRLVRDPVYAGRVAPLDAWIIGGGVSLTAAVIGWWIFCRWRNAIDYHA